MNFAHLLILKHRNDNKKPTISLLKLTSYVFCFFSFYESAIPIISCKQILFGVSLSEVAEVHKEF